MHGDPGPFWNWNHFMNLLDRSTTPPLLTPTLDAVDRGCLRHRRCRRPMHPWRFVVVITATKKETSHVEQSPAPENTGHVPTADLVGNVVTADGES